MVDCACAQPRRSDHVFVGPIVRRRSDGLAHRRAGRLAHVPFELQGPGGALLPTRGRTLSDGIRLVPHPLRSRELFAPLPRAGAGRAAVGLGASNRSRADTLRVLQRALPHRRAADDHATRISAAGLGTETVAQGRRRLLSERGLLAQQPHTNGSRCQYQRQSAETRAQTGALPRFRITHHADPLALLRVHAGP